MGPRPTVAIDGRRSDARRAYLEAHVFELLLAALAALAALGFFFQPDELARTAIGRAVHPFDYAWNVLYLTGGVLVTAGLVRPSYRLEVAGLVMLGAAIAGAAAALLAYRGANGLASLAIYTAAAGACFVRIHSIRAIEGGLAQADDVIAELIDRDRRRPR